MRLQVLSDLHLSVSSLDRPDTDADVVILAGDIARPQEAMAWASGFSQPVLYVAGNHEFYGGSLDGTLRELKRLGIGTGVQVLDCEETVIGGVRFLGATLWSDFKLFGEAQREQAIAQALILVRDYSRIQIDEAHDDLFSPDESIRLFARHVAWLQARLNEPFAGPTVVITHHAPSRRSLHPRFANSLLSACFVSDAEYLLGRDRVDLWVHGHTHDSFDYAVNGTRVLCNPRGYARGDINGNAAFDAALIVDVQSAAQ